MFKIVPESESSYSLTITDKFGLKHLTYHNKSRNQAKVLIRHLTTHYCDFKLFEDQNTTYVQVNLGGIWGENFEPIFHASHLDRWFVTLRRNLWYIEVDPIETVELRYKDGIYPEWKTLSYYKEDGDQTIKLSVKPKILSDKEGIVTLETKKCYVQDYLMSLGLPCEHRDSFKDNLIARREVPEDCVRLKTLAKIC